MALGWVVKYLRINCNVQEFCSTHLQEHKITSCSVAPWTVRGKTNEFHCHISGLLMVQVFLSICALISFSNTQGMGSTAHEWFFSYWNEQSLIPRNGGGRSRFQEHLPKVYIKCFFQNYSQNFTWVQSIRLQKLCGARLDLPTVNHVLHLSDYSCIDHVTIS